MPLTWATIDALAAGYFTFLISIRSLLCSASFAWSSFDMLGALASSLPAAVFDDAANAVEKLGTASANANPIIHPMFNLRIGIFLLVEYLVQARSRSFA